MIDPKQPANVYRYFEDIPLFWDAWDVEVYHLEKHWEAGVGTARLLESGPLRVVLQVIHPLSKTSVLEQKIILNANSAQIIFENKLTWNENRKVLKVEFPVLIKNDVATYETQFGFIQRPTHFNNSWDMARFEVCAHKFVDYSEYGYGVSLFNDCKYGFSVKDNVMRMTLLRAPKSPDDQCDIGEHTFRYALDPHQGAFNASRAVQKGYEFNIPLEPVTGQSKSLKNILESQCDHVIIDTIKKPQNRSELILVRLYEAYGGRSNVKLTSGFTLVEAFHSNVLEQQLDPIPIQDNTLSIFVEPFKVVSLLLKIK